MKDNGIEHIELWGVQPNPLVSKVREGIALCKDASNGIEAIIAVGGGSVIDSCKAIAGGAKLECDVYDYYTRKVKGPATTIPLFTVLTLSATASEFNNGSVVSNAETHEKLPAYFAYPIASAIDPTVQFGLPWKQVMCGACDSFSHLLETMLHTDDTDITTKQINYGLQKSIIRSMDLLVKDPKDYHARENFCWAISLALNGIAGFGLSQDWNVHYIEHAVSAFNDKISHGMGLAVITLQYYKEVYNRGIVKKQLEEWSEEVFGEKDPIKAVDKIKEEFIKWKAPTTLEELGVEEKDIKTIVDIEQHQNEIGIYSPILRLKREDTEKILRACLKH